jgi:hypothetical protein
MPGIDATGLLLFSNIRAKSAALQRYSLFSQSLRVWCFRILGECAHMGYRNYVARTLILLALALAVGLAVAVTSGDERARTVKHNSWFATQHQSG